MSDDPVIAAIRAARHAISAYVDHDPRKLVAFMRMLQSRHQDRVIGAMPQPGGDTRVPADVKEQILASLPPQEERERQYRDLMEKGGFSFDELIEP